MTSIIKVDEIQNKAGTTTLDADKLPNMLSGSAKAWHRFDASSGTPTTGDSLNISSITDGGTGIFTPYFTNNFANTKYSVGACGSNGNASLTSYNLAFQNTNTNNFGLRMHRIVSNAVALYDSAFNAYSIDGDLA